MESLTDRPWKPKRTAFSNNIPGHSPSKRLKKYECRTQAMDLMTRLFGLPPELQNAISLCLDFYGLRNLMMMEDQYWRFVRERARDKTEARRRKEIGGKEEDHDKEKTCHRAEASNSHSFLGMSFVPENLDLWDDQTPIIELLAANGDLEALDAVLSRTTVANNSIRLKTPSTFWPDRSEYISPIGYAFRNGDEGLIKVLLKHCDNSFGEDKTFQRDNPLKIAIARSMKDTVKELLKREDKKASTLDIDQLRALNQACQRGDMAMVELILPLPRVEASHDLRPDVIRSMLRMTTKHHLLELSKHLIQMLLTLESRGECCFWDKLLLYAVEEGSTVLVELLQSRADEYERLCQPNRVGRTVLSYAAERGSFMVVQLLLSNPGIHKQLHQRDEVGRTPLSYALHQRDIAGRTPLSHAAQHGLVETIELLLKTPSKHNQVDLTDDRRRTPLLYAAERGSVEAMQALLSVPNSSIQRCKANDQRQTPLLLAAKTGSVELVQLLLKWPEVRQQVAQADSSDRTPLLLAVRSGSVELVELLLKWPEVRQQVNSSDERRETPLLAAAEQGSVKLAERLLELGADVTAEDHCGQTPLMLAVTNNSIGLVERLIEHGADVTTEDRRGQTPLMRAVLGNSVELVERLLEHGADATLPVQGGDGDGTPLVLAAYNGHVPMLRLLLSQPGMIRGGMALHKAVLRGHEPAVRVLLEHTTKDMLNHVAEYYMHFDHPRYSMHTALTLAAKLHRPEILELLLARPDLDMKIHQEDESCRPPLFHALLHDKPENARLLVSRTHSSLLGRQYPFRQLHPFGYNCDASLLCCAVYHGYAQVVSQLLSRPDVNVNDKDSEGLSPLQHAIRAKRPQLVKLLLTRPDLEKTLDTDPNSTEWLDVLNCNDLYIMQLLLARRDRPVESHGLRPGAHITLPLISRVVETAERNCEAKVDQAHLAHDCHKLTIKAMLNHEYLEPLRVVEGLFCALRQRICIAQMLLDHLAHLDARPCREPRPRAVDKLLSLRRAQTQEIRSHNREILRSQSTCILQAAPVELLLASENLLNNVVVDLSQHTEPLLHVLFGNRVNQLLGWFLEWEMSQEVAPSPGATQPDGSSRG
ncbi:hypothetical protein ED733_001144 [Metarhizium rileyi]|uniref:Uncharacterized protein n=1 Tax=Metarhizium rileyi (strain RCEF 4871) TaxID=1649241 RepID=A0A5C6G2G4_METRR|nr:hypothetical protein ED733_001144 [Metarhizium rileyi]